MKGIHHREEPMTKRALIVVFATCVGALLATGILCAGQRLLAGGPVPSKSSGADSAPTAGYPLAGGGGAEQAAPAAPQRAPSLREGRPADADPPEPPRDGDPGRDPRPPRDDNGPPGPPPGGDPGRGPPLGEGGGRPEPPRDGFKPGRQPPGERSPSNRWPYLDAESLRTSDPEMYKLMKLDAELDRQSRDLAEQYSQAPQDQREKLRKQVQQVVSQHFDVRQERRLLELKRLKEELQSFQNAIDRRTKGRKDLIEKRVSDLLGSDERSKF
jgi:hypothetical protein